MGKIKKLRQKYHLSLKKSKSLNNLSIDGEKKKKKKETESKIDPLPSSKENIFAGIDIFLEDLNKTLPKDFDVKSIVSSRSRKELKGEERHLKKNEKKKLRHERFIQKLELTQQLIKASKLKKKNTKKNLSSDMISLLNALPSLQSLGVESSTRKRALPKGKPKGILKAKQRLKQQSLDAKVFNHILDDKMFKESPLQTINQYLKEKVDMNALNIEKKY